MLNAPVLRIDLASARPVYEQIVGGLRAFLVHGQFEAGERLPTVRQLATDLGVHHNTVAESYRVLAEEGWLELRRGYGATVLDRHSPRANAQANERFVRHLEELVAKAIAEGVPRTAVAGRIAEIVQKLANA